jgi:hypothetical protein
MTLITLYTSNNTDGAGAFPAQYFLQYTGAELHLAAAHHLQLGAPLATDGVFLIPASGEPRWIAP